MPGGFYADRLPGHAERMRLYAQEARRSRSEAIARLGEQAELGRITHLVVASCTGFVAPGVDQIIAAALGLEDVERTLIGFMGCYAAAAALRTAHHIVRSDPRPRGC
jgi:predicted naringenin-chalcone synthase